MMLNNTGTPGNHCTEFFLYKNVHNEMSNTLRLYTLSFSYTRMSIMRWVPHPECMHCFLHKTVHSEMVTYPDYVFSYLSMSIMRWLHTQTVCIFLYKYVHSEMVTHPDCMYILWSIVSISHFLLNNTAPLPSTDTHFGVDISVQV